MAAPRAPVGLPLESGVAVGAEVEAAVVARAQEVVRVAVGGGDTERADFVVSHTSVPIWLWSGLGVGGVGALMNDSHIRLTI